MIRIHLCKDLSRKLLESLLQSLIHGANSYLSRLAVNSDAIIYFDREVLEKFESDNVANDMVQAAFADLRSSRYRSVPSSVSDEVEYLRSLKEYVFFLSETPVPEKPYVIAADSNNFISTKLIALCEKGEISMSWNESTAENVLGFLKFVIHLKDNIERLIIVEREPDFIGCPILTFLLGIKTNSAVCYYRDSGIYSDRNCTKLAPFKSTNRTLRAVSDNNLIHERSIWANDAYFRIDNAHNSLNDRNKTWTINFTLDTKILSKTEGKFRCPTQYQPQNFSRRR